MCILLVPDMRRNSMKRAPSSTGVCCLGVYLYLLVCYLGVYSLSAASVLQPAVHVLHVSRRAPTSVHLVVGRWPRPPSARAVGAWIGRGGMRIGFGGLLAWDIRRHRPLVSSGLLDWTPSKADSQLHISTRLIIPAVLQLPVDPVLKIGGGGRL